jgi:hypothetical protein
MAQSGVMTIRNLPYSADAGILPEAELEALICARGIEQTEAAKR